MKNVGKWLVGLMLFVVVVVTFAFLAVFSGLAMILFGFLCMLFPVILDQSIFQESNEISIFRNFIRSHARKYGVLMMVIGSCFVYLGMQVGDVMFPLPPKLLKVQENSTMGILPLFEH